jgi:Domain of Unknown Function with PDB structure (DUF3857)
MFSPKGDRVAPGRARSCAGSFGVRVNDLVNVSLANASLLGVSCVAVPEWVDHAPYQAQAVGDDCIANGVCRLLQDVQVSLSGAEPAWHWRTAQRVLTRAGAEHVAHFVAEFDPAYQRLEVHFIRVLRGQDYIEHVTLAAPRNQSSTHFSWNVSHDSRSG